MWAWICPKKGHDIGRQRGLSILWMCMENKYQALEKRNLVNLFTWSCWKRKKTNLLTWSGRQAGDQTSRSTDSASLESCKNNIIWIEWIINDIFLYFHLEQSNVIGIACVDVAGMKNNLFNSQHFPDNDESFVHTLSQYWHQYFWCFSVSLCHN